MTHQNQIDLWPSLADFASDIGVAYGTAKAMRRRSSIPPKYWETMVAKADDRGIACVTYEALATAATPSSTASNPEQVTP